MAVNSQVLAAYSFGNFVGTISGVGGTVNFGVGGALEKSGAKITKKDNSNAQTVGVDGAVQNSQVLGSASTLEISVLKVSPINKVLTQMYNQQSANQNGWGEMTASAGDTRRGDSWSMSGIAFTTFPEVVYDSEGAKNVWTFDVAYCTPTLGGGTPSVV